MNPNLITLADGADMTARYRAEKESILASEYQESKVLPICESFSRDVFDNILRYDDCTGIRIYCGMDAHLNIKFVVCGINSRDEDFYLPASEGDFKVIENGVRCPDDCPPPSALNS